jgi:hypothetical protein
LILGEGGSVNAREGESGTPLEQTTAVEHLALSP